MLSPLRTPHKRLFGDPEDDFDDDEDDTDDTCSICGSVYSVDKLLLYQMKMTCLLELVRKKEILLLQLNIETVPKQMEWLFKVAKKRRGIII